MTRPSILVAVDLGEPSVAVARWAVRHLAAPSQVRLTHVVSLPAPPQFLRALYPTTDQMLEDARQGAVHRLRELSESFGGEPLPVDVRVGGKGTAPELIAAAKAAGADLLVIGPHASRTGLGRLFGSTAERVARHAPCSVLLARGLRGDPPRAVLVALDESSLAQPMLAWAAWCARRFGARIVVLHVVPIALGRLLVPGASPTELDRSQQRLVQQASAWVREQMQAAGLADATPQVAFGDPGLEVLSALQRHGAELLLIGRHGSGSSGGPFLGSVAEFLLRNGDAPVLLVAGPPPAD